MSNLKAIIEHLKYHLFMLRAEYSTLSFWWTKTISLSIFFLVLSLLSFKCGHLLTTHYLVYPEEKYSKEKYVPSEEEVEMVRIVRSNSALEAGKMRFAGPETDYSILNSDHDMIISYGCVSEEGRRVMGYIMILLISEEAWGPILYPSFVHPADPADEDNNLIVSFATGDSISTIKSWRVTRGVDEDTLSLHKNIGNLVGPDEAEYLTNDEMQKFKTADYISVTIKTGEYEFDEQTFNIRLNKMKLMVDNVDSSCNRS